MKNRARDFARFTSDLVLFNRFFFKIHNSNFSFFIEFIFSPQGFLLSHKLLNIFSSLIFVSRTIISFCLSGCCFPPWQDFSFLLTISCCHLDSGVVWIFTLYSFSTFTSVKVEAGLLIGMDVPTQKVCTSSLCHLASRTFNSMYTFLATLAVPWQWLS